MTARKRALITGGTGGIGRAIAEELGRLEYETLLNYAHDDDTARDVVGQLRSNGLEVSALKADVTDETAVERLFEDALQGGSLDILVNTVGDFLFKPLVQTTLAEWDATLRSNLTSAFLCSRAILPHMRSRGKGSIVTIASMNAEVLRAKPNTLPYAIANTGIVLLTKTLAATEGKHGIRVNAVCPGFVETGAYSPTRSIAETIPLGRLAHANEIAAAVSFLASEQASYVTGAILNAHGGAFL